MKDRKRAPQPTMDEQVAAQEERRRKSAERRFFRAFHTPDSYGLLLLMIATTFVIAVNATVHRGATLLVLVQIATVFLALHTSLAGRHLRRFSYILLVLAAIGAFANFFLHEESNFIGVIFVGSSILYFVAPVAIIRHVGFRTVVDQETMLGAVCAFLLIGLAFAFAYRFIAEVQAGPFFGTHGEGSLADDVFFSFTTLTTTGYGNLVPAYNPGQTLAVLEMLTGQLFLVTAVAKIVSAWRPSRWSQAPSDDDK